MPPPRVAQQWKAISLAWHLGLKPEFITNKEVPPHYAHISCYSRGCPRSQSLILLEHRSGFLEEHFCNSDRNKVGVLRMTKEYGDNVLLGEAIADFYPNVHTVLIDDYNCYFEWTVLDAYLMKKLKNLIVYGDPKLVDPIISLAQQFPQAHWIFVEMGYEEQYDGGRFRDILMLMSPNLKGLCFYSSTNEREKWAETYEKPVRDLYPTPPDWQAYELVDFYDIMDARWSYMIYERKVDPWIRRGQLLLHRYQETL